MPACRTSTPCARRSETSTSARPSTCADAPRSRRDLSASSPSCGTRSPSSTAAMTTASRRCSTRCSRRSRVTAADRPRALRASWTTSARSRRPGSIARGHRLRLLRRPVRRHLQGVRTLDYLDELGVGYLHLMPLLAPRAGANDGGYAVDGLRRGGPAAGHDGGPGGARRRAARPQDIALCVDLVLNHTAREHAWAQARAPGTRTTAVSTGSSPTAPSPTPTSARCSRSSPTWRPAASPRPTEPGGWVWTTFREFQWDLNWSNPDVFRAMLGVLLTLANRGVESSGWTPRRSCGSGSAPTARTSPRRTGSSRRCGRWCGSPRPASCSRRRRSSAPTSSSPYLGAHERFRPECDLAYDNQLMVMLWSAVAPAATRGSAHALAAMQPSRRTTSWVTYVRCHDDIGWAVTDEDARGGRHGAFLHRRFLADFYAGGTPARSPAAPLPGEPARPATRARAAPPPRSRGSRARWSGVTPRRRARADPALEDDVRRRLLVRRASRWSTWVTRSRCATTPTWAADPAHADDNRWLHRPPMDWAAAERRDRRRCRIGSLVNMSLI